MIALRSMKRVLVVDESAAVRETLAFILGREFEVVQRHGLSDEILSYSAEEVDLLILGLPSGFGAESPSVSKIALEVPFPILFLLDSRPSEGLWGGQGKVDWLTKPFNPYELKEKVARLLVKADADLQPLGLTEVAKNQVTRYLNYPYLPETTAALAKRFAVTRLPLLIVGEVGCGQEKIARAIYSSNHKAGAWISVYFPEMGEGSVLENISRSTGREGGRLQRATLFLGGLEALHSSAQASLLRFLENEEESGRELWLLSSSRVDLLEKVYREEFLEVLYYRLATLTLRLPPLRERLGDLPYLAAQMAREYGERLQLGKVSFSPEAIERLRRYLWFGNINELETVIARTLAIHRKGFIEAQDVVLGTGEEMKTPSPAVIEERAPSSAVPRLGIGDSPDFRVLINELAHELKNPMVTIKTFAQLLGERFDDVTFRTRFRERVGSDIERMDDLLEALVDFSRFSQPAAEGVALYDQVQHVLEEMIPECVKREASIRWGEKDEKVKVCVDQEQFRYAFENIVRAALSQVKAKGEIKVDVERERGVSVSYVREGSGPSPLSHYLGSAPQPTADEALPLRVLLAKDLLERNGGTLEVHRLGEGRIQIRTVVPPASALN